MCRFALDVANELSTLTGRTAASLLPYVLIDTVQFVSGRRLLGASARGVIPIMLLGNVTAVLADSTVATSSSTAYTVPAISDVATQLAAAFNAGNVPTRRSGITIPTQQSVVAVPEGPSYTCSRYLPVFSGVPQVTQGAAGWWFNVLSSLYTQLNVRWQYISSASCPTSVSQRTSCWCGAGLYITQLTVRGAQSYLATETRVNVTAGPATTGLIVSVNGKRISPNSVTYSYPDVSVQYLTSSTVMVQTLEYNITIDNSDRFLNLQSTQSYNLLNTLPNLSWLTPSTLQLLYSLLESVLQYTPHGLVGTDVVCAEWSGELAAGCDERLCADGRRVGHTVHVQQVSAVVSEGDGVVKCS